MVTAIAVSEQKTLAIDEYLPAPRLAPVGHGARPVEQLAPGCRAQLHVGELELDRLELVDRLAELPALARVADGVVGRALSQPDRLGAGTQTRALERRRAPPSGPCRPRR